MNVDKLKREKVYKIYVEMPMQDTWGLEKLALTPCHGEWDSYEKAEKTLLVMNSNPAYAYVILAAYV